VSDLTALDGPRSGGFRQPAGWLGEYRVDWLPNDIIAGVTLAAYAILVSLAYAGPAGKSVTSTF
jgi:MFS superfamily sulfate permease-like transporter